MAEQTILFGDEFLDVDLPDSVEVLTAGEGLPALEDPLGALRAAVSAPLDSPPLGDLARRAGKVLVAFTDPCIPAPLATDPDPRAVALPEVMRVLEGAGVAAGDVRVICATGLHRKFTRAELAEVAGRDFVSRLPPQRLRCHDSLDPEGLVFVGETGSGLEVEVAREVLEADLVVYVNVSQITMNGGWSSMVIGLGSFRSIRHHHHPDAIFAERSFIEPESPMQSRVAEMGRFLEEAAGRKFFQIEAVLGSGLPYSPAGFRAGRVDAAHASAQALLAQQQDTPVAGEYDVVVVGVPSFSPYAVFSEMNPILVHMTGLGYAFHLYRGRPLVRPGGVVVLANPLRESFHPIHHPSYRELYERGLAVTRDPRELWDLFAEDYAHRPEFVHAYRHGQAFHGAHPVICYAWGAHALAHARVLAAGADPVVAERLGYEPFATVEEAVAEATRRAGARAALFAAPPLFAADLRGTPAPSR
ncbi:MAG: DUF2088 domain-containing protein [Acidobacteria bacterium]|nr:DUF2088 domain-containing protein [Acidobacteriota bacterium]